MRKYSIFESFVLDAEFKNLDRRQFDSLKSIYGDCSQTPSRTTYEPLRSWLLSDFLPPAMQAALNFRFINERRLTPLPQLFSMNTHSERTETPVLLVSDCWGTLYEVLRHAQTFQSNPHLELFYAPHKAAKSVFFDPRWSAEVRPYSKQATFPSEERNAGLVTGDVLLVGKEWFQHVAIFIDDDVYFEKAGTGNTALYRLTDWDTLAKTWPPDLHGYSWRRYNQQAFPESSELFNMSTSVPNNEQLSQLTPEELRKFTLEPAIDDSTGRPVGGSWFERRKYLIDFDTQGRANITKQAH